MTVEAVRGCGFRKVGGMYLCGEKVKLTCGRDWKFHGACPGCGKEILE